MGSSNTSKGNLATATLHAGGTHGVERRDTSKNLLGCKEILTHVNKWAANGEWASASVGYALAAISEYSRLSREAWLSGFYSAMAMLIDRSTPPSDPSIEEIIRSACAIVTDGAESQMYDEKDNAELLSRIESTSEEEGRSRLYLEHARVLLRTKLWMRASFVESILLKKASIEEQIETHLIQACLASLRKKDDLSMRESFDDAMQLKFGNAVAAGSPRSVKFDKLIESMSSLFLEEGAGLDVSGKTDNGGVFTEDAVLFWVNEDPSRLATLVMKLAPSVQAAGVRSMLNAIEEDEFESLTAAWKKTQADNYERLVFGEKKVKDPKTRLSIANDFLRSEFLRHELAKLSDRRYDPGNQRRKELRGVINYFCKKEGWQLFFHPTTPRLVAFLETGQEEAAKKLAVSLQSKKGKPARVTLTNDAPAGTRFSFRERRKGVETRKKQNAPPTTYTKPGTLPLLSLR